MEATSATNLSMRRVNIQFQEEDSGLEEEKNDSMSSGSLEEAEMIDPIPMRRRPSSYNHHNVQARLAENLSESSEVEPPTNRGNIVQTAEEPILRR